MYVDEKVTIWIRSTVQCNYEDIKTIEGKIHDLLQQGMSFNQVCHDLELETTLETLVETEQPVTLEGNEGESTIEFYDEDGAIIFSNGTATK